jgi:DNA-binding response OmpR family regulator
MPGLHACPRGRATPKHLDPAFMDRIALVEDHPRLSALVCRALADVGVEVDCFGGIESAWQALRATSYAAAVIDRGLPDGDGLDLVRRMRAAGQPIPCLMLTARDALHDRVEGLESGADDYLVKPFPMSEMVARVRALMRRPPAFQILEASFGDIVVRPEEARIRCGEQAATLSPAELQIMLNLLKSSGAVVRRSALEAAAWGLADPVTPGALDVALHRLRRKLLAVGSRLEIINLRGHGYAVR